MTLDSFKFKTAVVGTYYQKSVTEEDIEKLKSYPVALILEPQNTYDSNAIKCVVDNVHIGYIPRNVASTLAPLLKLNGSEYRVKWIGPGSFGIEVSVEVVDGLSIVDPDAYRKRLLAGLIVCCESINDRDVVLNKLQEIEGTNFSKWHIINQSEPLIAALRGRNLESLKALLDYGFKNNLEKYKALRLAVATHQNQAFVELTKTPISSAGYTYALVESHIANNHDLTSSIANENLDIRILKDYLRNAVIERNASLVRFLQRFEMPQELLNTCLIEAAHLGALYVVKALLHTRYDRRTSHDAILASMSRGHLLSYAVLLRDTVQPDEYNGYFNLTFYQERFDFASATLKLGREKLDLVELILFVVSSPIDFDRVGYGLMHDLRSLVSESHILALIDSLETQRQFEKLVKLTDSNPLDLIAYSERKKFRRWCYETFNNMREKQYAGSLKKHQKRYYYYMGANINSIDVHPTIVEKLKQYKIHTLFDLKLCNDYFLKNAVGLTRIELNDIEFAFEVFDSSNSIIKSSKEVLNLSHINEREEKRDSTNLKSMASDIGIPVSIEKRNLLKLIDILKSLK